MDEKWKRIENTNYSISNRGYIKNITKDKIIVNYQRMNGYLSAGIMKNGKLKTLCIHRTVAEYFLDGYKEGMVVNHINGNKTDNRVENLEWITQSSNIKKGLKTRKNNVPVDVFKYDTNEYVGTFESLSEAARKLNINSYLYIINNLNGDVKQVDGYYFKKREDNIENDLRIFYIHGEEYIRIIDVVNKHKLLYRCLFVKLNKNCEYIKKDGYYFFKKTDKLFKLIDDYLKEFEIRRSKYIKDGYDVYNIDGVEYINLENLCKVNEMKSNSFYYSIKKIKDSVNLIKLGGTVMLEYNDYLKEVIYYFKMKKIDTAFLKKYKYEDKEYLWLNDVAKFYNININTLVSRILTMKIKNIILFNKKMYLYNDLKDMIEELKNKNKKK